MELTTKEKKWYEKLRTVGLCEDNSNRMARIICLLDEFRESNPDEVNTFKGLFNQEGPFSQFCIDSGRLTSDEIHHLFRSLQSTDNSFNNPYSIRYNPVETLWGYFKNIFK